MKKRKLKALREAAKNIPQSGHKTFALKSGKEILEVNPNATDKDGSPVIKDMVYKVQKTIATDNYRKLKKYFKQPQNRKKINEVYKESFKTQRQLYTYSTQL